MKTAVQIAAARPADAKKIGAHKGHVLARKADMPTEERCRQAPVVVVEERDPEGWPIVHARAVDTLTRLVRNGMISPAWAAAGSRFRHDYHAAHYQSLSAVDLTRERGAGGREKVVGTIEDARQRVYEALSQLGGMSAPAGSIVWHVIGGEMSLRDWSLRQVWGSGRTIRQEVATGILIGALGALSGYYANLARVKSRRDATR
ncbi:MAG TPA: hypothetical protein VL574_01720 [Stellaceae bacterium]|nr:hypothetical protein [Stellaceae bacterium]